MMKKIFALLIAMVMVLGMSTMVLAATIVVETGTTAADGTESQDVLKGETYSAYKILNYTSADTNADGTPDAYSYFLTATQYEADADGKAVADGLGDILEKAGFKFEISADGTQYVLTNADEITDAAPVAEYLYTNKAKVAAKAIAKVENQKASADKEVVFSGLDTGYWFVTSSLGALASLQSYDDEALIVEKNQTLVPPPKAVSDNEAQVGDILTYTVTLTDVKGTNLKAQIVDTMSEGLTYNGDAELVAKVGGTETTLTKGTEYTETTDTDDDNTVITWEITAEQMTAMDVGDTIVVTYTATVNEKASIDGTEWNTAITRYSEQETDGVPVEVTTTNLTINKKDPSGAALKGAQFELYRTDEDANPAVDHEIVKLTEMTEDEILKALGKDADGNQIQPDDTTHYYKVDPASDNTTIDMAVKDDAGEYIYSSARIFGIDEDSKYYLLETKAPEGYNQLNEEKVVEPGENTIDVINESGSILPSTGGIGTTIFYVGGAILVLGAAVLLVSRRKAV